MITIQNVLVATDFSPESIAAARAALPLLADGATLHLVHAWRRIATVFPSAELAQLNDRYAASLPEQFQRFIASEVRKWTEVVKAANIKGDL